MKLSLIDGVMASTFCMEHGIQMNSMLRRLGWTFRRKAWIEARIQVDHMLGASKPFT